ARAETHLRACTVPKQYRLTACCLASVVVARRGFKMRTKSLLPPFVAVLLVTSVLSPVARMQQRGLTVGAPAGKYYALIIGNNAYTSLPKLKTAEADAREIERLLRESYGFQTRLLVNATRAQVVSALS